MDISYFVPLLLKTSQAGDTVVMWHPCCSLLSIFRSSCSFSGAPPPGMARASLVSNPARPGAGRTADRSTCTYEAAAVLRFVGSFCSSS